MDLLDIRDCSLTGLDRLNIVLGKNGCGKSRLLKLVDEALRGRQDVGALKYVSPERAGTLKYEPHVERDMASSPTYLADTRRQNQAAQFREQSAVQFRRLELLVLREIERDAKLRSDPTETFDKVVSRINTLLDRVYVERGDPAFVIKERSTGRVVDPNSISSGESELISLGIECLVFMRECVPDKTNLLLLDEPDVHLHPDLQARFGQFLSALIDEAPITVLLATHSTAFLGATPEDAAICVAFMRYGDTQLAFSTITDVHRRVLPVFGAHPLSNVFNDAPCLLLEGEDDERIWQQAVRSSQGQIRLYPVAVDSIDRLNEFELEVVRILEAVYDDAVGYSLRDRDEAPEHIDDLGPIRRFRLSARTAENLLLTDDVISRAGINWETLQDRISAWVAANERHPHHLAMKTFVDGKFDRKNADLKEIRNDLVGLMGSNKPWEVLVGQAIARAAQQGDDKSGHSIRAYLGDRLCQELLSA